MRFRMTGLALAAGFALSAAALHAVPADDQAASELKQYHRHHHQGGVTNFIAMSLDTLGTDEAKTPQVDKLHADLHAQMAPAREAENDLLLTLADGVAAGSVDRVKVDATIATLTAAADAKHAASLDTLNELHAILSPAERDALAEKVQAHWEVWHQTNQDERAARRERGGRVATLTRELSLTPAQANKISAAVHTAQTGHSGKFDPKRGEAHVEAFSKAFASDSFDAKSLTLNVNPELAGHGAARMALFYETVTPLLTPAQRTKLAEHLRERATDESTTTVK
jgi:Spy/CpxP family protein refolding chaperone